jgi:cell division protein FtsB
LRRFWLAPAMLAGAILYAGIDPGSGLRTWWQLRGELRESRQRAEHARVEIDRLEGAARRLDGDPFAMEEAIREDLGLARPGETVVLFDREGGSSARNP